MLTPVRDNGRKSWVGAIRNKSLDLGNMIVREENGQKVYYIPHRSRSYHSGDAYPVSYTLEEV